MKNRRTKSRTQKSIMLVVIILAALALIAWKANPAKLITEQMTVPFEEITIADELLSNKYYYQQLNETEKIIYKELLQGVQNENEEIYVHSGDGGAVNRIFNLMLNDYPELFYCDGSAQTSSFMQQFGDGKYSVVKPTYTYKGEERITKQQEIENAANEILGRVSKDAPEYDKIKFVFDTLVNETDYNLEATDNQNIYSVFVNKVSVCAGYAKATQYLLEKLEVYCTYVTGNIIDQGPHGWNLVKCDGNFYYVDTTWGDPVFLQEEDEPVSEVSNINYDYLCCNDAELFKTHTLDEDLMMPECTSLERNYYVLNGMYYESYDSSQLLNAMIETINAGGVETVFKFASDELYNEAHSPLLVDLVPQALNYLGDTYGLYEVQYSYVEDPNADKFEVIWNYE